MSGRAGYATQEAPVSQKAWELVQEAGVEETQARAFLVVSVGRNGRHRVSRFWG